MGNRGTGRKRVMVERRVQESRHEVGGGTKGGKRIVTLLCCRRNVVILYHRCHQPDSLQLVDVCSGWCDHAGR